MQRLGGQARDSRDKSECDSAVCSSLHGTHSHRVVIWSFSIFLTWTVQLFLPGSWQFLPGPCPRGTHPGDGAANSLKSRTHPWGTPLPHCTTRVVDSVPCSVTLWPLCKIFQVRFFIYFCSELCILVQSDYDTWLDSSQFSFSFSKFLCPLAAHCKVCGPPAIAGAVEP